MTNKNVIKTVLGIDIGTSSVKCSVVNIKSQDSYKILSSGKCQYDPVQIKRSLNPSYSQQNVQEIFAAIKQALLDARVSTFQIDLIAVCGQMHGVVLWNSEQLFDQQNELNYLAVSDQYDWTDGRCDPKFLSTLPTPDSYADKISTGYGCATLFWLHKYEPQLIKKFDRSGTIMDFFTVVLCKLNHSCICLQNAHNWGYFDPETNSWNIEILKSSGFPTDLLPTLAPLDQIVGNSTDWNGIAPEIPVTVSYGDMQSIMHLAFLNKQNALVLNMGTSAQLCRLEPIGFKPEKKSTSQKQPAVDYFPFMPNRYLAVAASLNGGNVLRNYAVFLQEIVHKLTGIELREAEVWNKLSLICHDEPQSDSQFLMKPTLFGERHEPESSFSIAGIRFQPPKLSELTRNLCQNLLENIFDMLALGSEECTKVTSIVCTGTVFAKNKILQEMFDKVIEKRFVDNFTKNVQGCTRLEVQFMEHCDADVGCALFAYSQLFSNL